MPGKTPNSADNATKLKGSLNSAQRNTEQKRMLRVKSITFWFISYCYTVLNSINVSQVSDCLYLTIAEWRNPYERKQSSEEKKKKKKKPFYPWRDSADL